MPVCLVPVTVTVYSTNAAASSASGGPTGPATDASAAAVTSAPNAGTG